jgi:hypothetical protein
VSTAAAPDRVRSTALLGLRGQAWVLAGLGVLWICYVVASLVLLVMGDGDTDQITVEPALRLAGYAPLLVLSVLSFAAAALSLRHPERLDPAVSGVWWWAGSWAAMGVFTTLLFVTSFWTYTNSLGVLGAVAGGSVATWFGSRPRAAHGWRPGWIYWSTGAALVPGPFAQPGWKLDPELEGGLRWWNGYRWTDDRAPAPFNGYPRPSSPNIQSETDRSAPGRT